MSTDSNEENPDISEMDLKKTIDERAERVNLDVLAKKGIQKVKVINRQTILKLIDEAVQRIIATKTDLLSEQEREEILNRSKEELNRLISEQKAIKDKAEIAEQDKNDLVKEVMNLNEQIRVMHTMHDDETARRFDDGVKSQQSLIDELKNEIQTMRTADEAAKANQESQMARRFEEGVKSQQPMIDDLKLKIEKIRAEQSEEQARRFDDGVKSQQSLVDELKNEIQTMRTADESAKANQENQRAQRFEEGVKSQQPIIDDLKLEIEKIRAEQSEEQARRFEEGVSSQQSLIDGLRGEIEILKSKEGTTRKEHEAALTRRYEEGVKSQQALIDELRGEISNRREMEATEKVRQGEENNFIRERLEELGKSDDTIASNIESLFEKMSESLSEKISAIQVSGGSGGGGGSYADIGQVSLENIFKEELESNLKEFAGKKEKKKTSLKGSLARLKAMRGDDGEGTLPAAPAVKEEEKPVKVDKGSMKSALSKLKGLKKPDN